MRINGLNIASVATAVLALSFAAPASAGMIGGAATSQYYAYGAASGPSTTFAIDGAAHARFYDFFDVIVTDTQIIYDFRASGTWSASATSLSRDGLFIDSGNLLTLAGIPGLASVSVNSATNMAGFSASNVTWNEGEIAVAWAGRSFNASTLLVLDVVTAANSTQAVAEPPALAMMGLGGLGLIALRIKRRRA